MSGECFRGSPTDEGVKVSWRFFLLEGLMIDFKSYDEQIDILKKRGLVIANEDNAKKILKTNNYYNVVNAYKDIFIKKGFTPEKFIEGTTYEELCALHKFDKDLRLILSNELIVIERMFKSIIAHEFSKKCPDHDLDYLNIYKYDITKTVKNKSEGLEPVLLSSQLVRDLNKELINSIDYKDEMISHYKAKYNRVPLWVFVNKLSFGTMSKMYSALQAQDQANVAKSIKDIVGRNVYANEIQNAIKVLVILRNRAAHDQRLYDFSSAPITVNGNNIFLKNYGLKNVQSLFGAIGCMSVFFPQDHFNALLLKIKRLIESLFLSIHSIPTKSILDKMGIPFGFLN